MNAEKILQSNLLDILFENRNKLYGAYALRSQYNRQLYKALGFIFLLTVIILLLSQVKNDVVKSFVFAMPGPEPTSLPVPDKPIPPVVPRAPAPRPSGSNASATVFTSNVVITADSLSKIPLPANLDSIAIGTISQPGNGKKLIGQEPGPVEIKKEGSDVNEVDKETPLPFAEVMPEFPGGQKALQTFLEKNLKSPADIDAGDFVSVKIKFIVGYDGVLKGFQLVEDGGKIFNNEVIRVLKKMPQWIPGKSRGENVSVYYTIPVKFTGME
ncbi:MAG: energy transducer TonB [Ferruginibacter sp.]